MIKIGITGQNGFVGTHLFNTIGLLTEEFERINFQRSFFDDEVKLESFVSKCDVIVQLAAVNRHENPKFIYDTNTKLVDKLVAALIKTNSRAHVIFSSSTQEANNNIYGKSKKDCREIMKKWAQNSEGKFTGMIIPNVFGPFGHPNYNSVIATFCYKIAKNENPTIDVNGDLKFIYVGELVSEIISEIRKGQSNFERYISYTSEAKVSDIATILQRFKIEYQDNGLIPIINNIFELNLFNTFRSYMDIKNHFPVKCVKHSDERGDFVELIQLGIGGQVSFSTTIPGVTRGNHFHTRKIERFAVIKGKALIQLRRIGTDEIIDFYLDGNEPAYVDMPIWYTHNITNIGKNELYTNFWINEIYDPKDSDTYFEKV